MLLRESSGVPMSPAPSERLRSLGLTLPAPPAPLGSYAPAVREGPWVWVSGQGATRAGAVLYPGRVPETVSLVEAREAARDATLQAVSAVAALAGSIDRIRRVVRVTVYVASAPTFTQQHEVANGATELLVALFGEEGRPSRVAVGVSALPREFPVELDLVAIVE
jgi:enamine deaminase RidA (YjgF/YER057c/UK114 family)